MSALASGIIGGITGIANLIGAGVAARNSAKANQAALAELDKQKQANDDWWAKKQNESYMDTAEGQAAMNKSRELAMEQMAQARASNAVMGGSPASIAASQQAANSLLSDTVGNLVQTGEQRKMAAEQQYLNTNSSLAQQVTDVYKQRAAQNAAAGSAALQSLGSIGGSIITALGNG